MRRTVHFTGGITATYGFGDRVQVGDRWVPSEILVTSRTENEPDLTMKIEVRKGVPVYTEITFRARADGPEVRKRDLDLPLEEWLQQIIAACSMTGSADADGRWTTLLQPIEDPGAVTNARRVRAGRPRSSDERLQKVADIYRENIDGRPTEAVKDAFGYGHRHAARLVQQARAAGLLPETTPGKRKV
jgi:hypothetical protein